MRSSKPIKRRWLAGLLLLACSCAVVSAAAAGAANTTRLTWILTGANANIIHRADSALASYLFNTPKAFLTGAAWGEQVQGPKGYRSSATLKYTSLADFERDWQNGHISADIHAVIYDPEKWPQTPPEEQQDPVAAMKQFASIAHEAGYRIIMTPARDLMMVPGAKCGKKKGDDLDTAFIRCNIAGAASKAPVDVFQLQSQVSETDPDAYRDFIAKTKAQAVAANPKITFLAGFSTSPEKHAVSADQLWKAFLASHDLVAGYYFTICNSCSGEMATAQTFLRKVQAAGY